MAYEVKEPAGVVQSFGSRGASISSGPFKADAMADGCKVLLFPSHLSKNLYGALRRFQEAHDDMEQGCLSTSIGGHQTDAVAFIQLEIDLVQYGFPVRVLVTGDYAV